MAPRAEPTISAVLIVKDEEEYLARCLESVRWADEIVVYDTGSTDRTVAIAREFTDRVVEGYWDDDFGAARNRALSHATGDWVLSIDADEEFSGNEHSLRRHLARGRANSYTLPVHARVVTPGSVAMPVVVRRIFRRSDCRFAGALHEQVVGCPGVRVRSEPMPGAVLRHAGYSEGPEAMAARAQRNLALAEREMSQSIGEPPDSPLLAQRRANLARTLSSAGRDVEALELAEETYQSGALSDSYMEPFATAMALIAAERAKDFELARTWAERLREVVGNPVWVATLLVQIAGAEGDPEGVLEALTGVPTTMVDARGRRVRRVDYSRNEIWALWRLGRTREAGEVAEAAARAGVLPAWPTELVNWLDTDGRRNMLAVLTKDSWQLLAVLCTHASRVAGVRRVLVEMAQVRPNDLAPLLCASRLSFPSDLAGLEEAAEWSARVRAAGLSDHCPLIAIALAEATPAPQRARAAALGHYAYGDGRALPALEIALSGVVPEEEAELAAQLDVLAPGLVQLT